MNHSADKQEPRPFGWRRAVMSILVIVLLLAGSAVGFNFLSSLKKSAGKTNPEPRRIPVSVETLARTEFREKLKAYGRARSLVDAQLANEVAGRVVWISKNLESGQVIAKNDILLKIDPSAFLIAEDAAAARREQAAAELKREQADVAGVSRRLALTRAEWKVSRHELDRVKGLVAQGTSPQSDLDVQRRLTTALERSVVALEADLETRRLQLPVRTAALKLAETDFAARLLDLSLCEVKSLYNATVVERLVQLGERLAVGTKLVHITDPSLIEVAVSMPASIWGQISQGTNVHLSRSSGDGSSWDVAISRVAPVIMAAERSFFIYVVLDGDGAAPPPAAGDFLEATILGREFKNAHVLPRTALLGDTVYVAVGDGGKGMATAHARRVVISHTLPDRVIIEKGLEDGEKVIIDNLEEIAHKSKVRIINKEDGQ